MSIAEHIKLIRGELSQSQFGKKIGASYRTVQSWETGESFPGSTFLNAIRRNFDVNIDWLLSGDGDPYITRDTVKNNSTTNISDSKGLFGKTEHYEVEGKPFRVTTFDTEEPPPQEVKMGAAIEQLVQVLSSGNQILINAILKNLEAFSMAAEREKVDADRILKLETKCDDLITRLNIMEANLAAMQDGLKKQAAQ